jgi:hypothetical protein
MYARNDLGVSTMETGTAEVQHAASYDDVVEFAVVKPATLEITPSNVNLRYTDADAGEPASSTTQGILEVITVLPCPGNTALGSLFVDYDVEFFANSLDLIAIENLSQPIVLDGSAYAHTQANVAVFLAANAASAGTARMINLPALSSSGANAGWMAEGVVTAVTGTPPIWAYADDDRTFTVAVGQGLWMAFGDGQHANNWANGSISCIMFADYESAQLSSPLLWGDTANTTFTITIALRAWDAGRDD